MIDKLFLEHPRSVGESYWQHLAMASCFSGRMLLGAVACFLHALVPGLCIRTGSRTITELHDRMVLNRARLRAPAE
ncbi:hypothetical protein A8950_2430 [Dongia mobilis]|uniref:Type 1 capsular polysaccharide biosynthesis protein J n=1 Tax=Dongia mobilis TaxID=578943 RepID=A0A4R6WKZ4_9PROT|nr:DUF6356 family protein [Dongia mobilis]TDQ81362.1 hypothetical protein A8950_2430 [Dongia mobilis]